MMDKMTHRTAHAPSVAPAVPAGGARLSGWGRDRPFLASYLAVLVLCPALAAADPALPAVPSGVALRLHEHVLDVKPDGVHTYARFRFVAPAIGQAGGPGYADLTGDFQVLCDAYALPIVLGSTPPPDRIVISIADRETEMGVAAPEATQFFELFRPETGRCIWEEF